jgi:hypothetical protein
VGKLRGKQLTFFSSIATSLSSPGKNPVLACLDRAFFNTSWNDAFPNSALSPLPHAISDHHPLVVSAATTIPNPPPPTSILKTRGCLIPPSSLQCWSPRVPLADAALGIAASIKRFRSAAKVWKREHPYVAAVLLLIFLILWRSPGCCPLRSSISGVVPESTSLRRCAGLLRTGSSGPKFGVLKEGDSNRSYFHARALQCYRERERVGEFRGRQ